MSEGIATGSPAGGADAALVIQSAWPRPCIASKPERGIVVIPMGCTEVGLDSLHIAVGDVRFPPARQLRRVDQR